MKRWNFLKPSGGSNRNALRGGAYSLAISAVVLAILIVVNLFASALPAAATKYDISASKLYSITSNTKVVVNALEEDVTIYWVVQSGQEDAVIENLLGKYDSLSDHIQVVKKNPDVYPTFAEQYTDETVRNNSLIVECGDRSRFIGYQDIYVQTADMYSYSYNTSFDGEGAITSAIDYVVSEELPRIYILEGHGEAGLPASFREQIEKENMETQTLSLLTVDEISEDADCVMLYAPASDISREEKELLANYAAQGGKLFVAAGPAEEGILENLYDLLGDYGVEANEGIVVENDREHYSGLLRLGPLALLPDLHSDGITDALIEENYYPIMPISLGLTVTGDSDGGTVTELLTTSHTAYSKLAGYGMTNYEKEDGDIDGPFALAVSIETAGEGQIVWFTSSQFLEDMYNAATFAVTGMEERKEQIKETGDIILELPGESVESLSWEYNENSLAFHKDGVWLYDGDENFPVSEEKINGLLEQFQAFGAAFIIENVEDFGQYGLDDPLCTIRLSTAEQDYEVKLGDYSKMDAQRYVSIGDGNVYLAKHDPLDEFDATIRNLIDHDEVPDLDQVTEIIFSGTENYSITYEEESDGTYREQDVYFTVQNGKSLPLDTGRVEDYLNYIEYLNLTDYVTYNATEEELSACGLDDPEPTVAVNYTVEEDGQERSDAFVLHISRDPEEKKSSEEQEDEEEEEITAYARVGDSGIIYQISSAGYKRLMAASYDDFRHLEVLPAAFEEIRQVDISLEGSSYTLTSEQDGKERTWSYQGEELEIDSIQSALNALTAEEFTTEKPSGKEEISLTLSLDREDAGEVQIQCRLDPDTAVE